MGRHWMLLALTSVTTVAWLGCGSSQGQEPSGMGAGTLPPPPAPIASQTAPAPGVTAVTTSGPAIASATPAATTTATTSAAPSATPAATTTATASAAPNTKPQIECYRVSFRKPRERWSTSADDCGPRGIRGLSDEEIRGRFGEPHRREGNRWIYVLPEGCAYEKAELTVIFAAKRVVKATAKHIWTGEHCSHDFGQF